MGQPVVYFDIGCKEKDKTEGFYSKIFGWKPLDRSEHTVMLDTDSGGIPGAITSLGHEPHNYVMIYIEVDDIEGYLKKVEANGGEVLVPMTEIPDGGHFAWFGDPEGNMIGLLDPGSDGENG